MFSILSFVIMQVPEIGAYKDLANGLTLIGGLIIAVVWFEKRDKKTIARYEEIIKSKDAENARIRSESESKMEKILDRMSAISDKSINAINEQANTNKQLVNLLQDMRGDLKRP